jgi:hypothetical protein
MSYKKRSTTPTGTKNPAANTAFTRVIMLASGEDYDDAYIPPRTGMHKIRNQSQIRHSCVLLRTVLVAVAVLQRLWYTEQSATEISREAGISQRLWNHLRC